MTADRPVVAAWGMALDGQILHLVFDKPTGDDLTYMGLPDATVVPLTDLRAAAEDSDTLDVAAQALARSDGAGPREAGWTFLREQVRQRHVRHARAVLIALAECAEQVTP